MCPAYLSKLYKFLRYSFLPSFFNNFLIDNFFFIFSFLSWLSFLHTCWKPFQFRPPHTQTLFSPTFSAHPPHLTPFFATFAPPPGYASPFAHPKSDQRERVILRTLLLWNSPKTKSTFFENFSMCVYLVVDYTSSNQYSSLSSSNRAIWSTMIAL